MTAVPKKFGHVGVIESATSPAGNIGLIFGYDYDRQGGKPHLAALMSWQDARAMAQHIMSVTQPHATKAPESPNRPKPPPAGKELVKKTEPAQEKRVRVRQRRS